MRWLEGLLSREGIGEDGAVRQVARTVRRGLSGLRDAHRPVACMMLTGPTGVGKTELCRAMAELVFGTKEAFQRLDMSEYMDGFTASRLIGAPPGYVGYDEGGELTEKVRRRPYCLLLLDEVDKAHRDVMNLLLQVMEEGVMTDSMGRKADFRHAMIVMTCNLGAAKGEEHGLGFQPGTRQDRVREAVRAHFSREFLGRLDGIIPFAPLGQETMEQIAESLLEQTVQRMAAAGFRLSLEPGCAAALAEAGMREQSGARGIRSVLRSRVEAAAAQLLLSGCGEGRLIPEPQENLWKTVTVKQ